MTLIVDLPGELEAVLLAEAQAQGVSADRFARRVLEQVLTAPAARPGTPFETGRGMLAQYGLLLSVGEGSHSVRDDLDRGTAFPSSFGSSTSRATKERSVSWTGYSMSEAMFVRHPLTCVSPPPHGVAPLLHWV